MKVSIIVPFHNEENIVKTTIQKLLNSMKFQNYKYEIIAVDDNSDDKTGDIIDKLSEKYKIIKPVHIKNNFSGPSGLGAALKHGFSESSGDVIIAFMGDLSDDPNDIPKMLKKINDGFDVVCGSRFIKGSNIIGYPKIKLICNRAYNLIFSFLFNIPTNDISNAFKAYKKIVLKTVEPKSNGFEITSEIVLKAHIKKFRINEVPVTWHEKKNRRESKFGSFSSLRFLFFKLPIIGIKYGKLSLSLWLKFILSRLK